MADGYECVEMRRSQTWTYQVDSFALGATAHALLHFPEDKIALESIGGRWRPQRAPPESEPGRAALWRRLFDEVLNVPSAGPQPDLRALADAIEAYFNARVERRVALKEALQMQHGIL